jgi:2,3-bisphosphoglycerate-independent phosphoglycerate mutase
MNKPTLLCILDGFGLNPNSVGNAVALAKKPNFDSLWNYYPHATLTTFGEAVGLPEGQMGNSEVGHLNIGAGRCVEQWLLRISRALAGPFLASSKEYQTFISSTKSSKTIHAVGLYSSGGVHSHLEHAKLLVKRLSADTTATIALHLISDGRDVSPSAFQSDLKDLEQFITSTPRVEIRSICGRFFAMDRDNRWERVQQAYDAIALGNGAAVTDPQAYVAELYAKGTTDEFLDPGILTNAPVEKSDGFVFFNFARTVCERSSPRSAIKHSLSSSAQRHCQLPSRCSVLRNTTRRSVFLSSSRRSTLKTISARLSRERE